MKSAWDLMMAGRYEAACAAADEEAARYQSHRRLGNKVLALLAMKRFSEAASLSAHLIELDGTMAGDSDYLMHGAALWSQGHYEEAVSVWKDSYAAAYTDAAGGVEAPLIVMFAGIRLGRKDIEEEAAERLNSLLEEPAGPDGTPEEISPVFTSIENWPGPLARFMCGKLTERKLVSTANSGSWPEPLRRRYRCQARFFIGVARLAAGDEGGFCRAMKKSYGEGGVAMLEVEFYLARTEHESCVGRGYR